MNIFVPHRDVRKNAQALDDARLRKMCLESAQMLCTVLNLHFGKQVTPYKNAHVGNRVTKWAMKPHHWKYLWFLGFELCREYHYRFDKAHACIVVISECGVVCPQEWMLTEKKVKRFCNAARREDLGLDFTHMKDVHKAHRKYLRKRWKTDKRTPTWTRRGPPSWR